MEARSPAPPSPSRPVPAATGLVIGLVIVGALAILGAIALWPRGAAPDLGEPGYTYVDGTILDADRDTCPAWDLGRPEEQIGCTVYTAELTSGENRGSTVEILVTDTMLEVPEVEAGDKVVLRESRPGALSENDPSTDEPARFYMIDGFQRSTPMVWLLVVFVVAVLAFGRWQGLRALVGLGLSLLVLTLFIVPSLLRDEPALLVALIGSALVAYLAIYLAHGLGISSSIALTGTLVSLALTAVLAMVMASLAHLTGLTGEEAAVLNVTADALNLRGLLVAGIIIGALGVLDDVTVSQVATVAALRRANRSLTARQLYTEAISVGRDHVAAAVNTLVLAYAGASLPLMLFIAQGNHPLSRILTGELVAVEIIRMLVGSIGLILSVPITTGLAAMILSRGEPPDHHGHSHGTPPAPVGPVDPPVGGDRDEIPPGQDHSADAGSETPRHLAPNPQDPPVRPWF